MDQVNLSSLLQKTSVQRIAHQYHLLEEEREIYLYARYICRVVTELLEVTGPGVAPIRMPLWMNTQILSWILLFECCHFFCTIGAMITVDFGFFSFY